MFLRRWRKAISQLPKLAKADQIKYLVTTIDNKLIWTQYIDQMCGKLSSALYVLKGLRQICKPEVVRIAILHYLNPTYDKTCDMGGSSKGNLNRILIQQEKDNLHTSRTGTNTLSSSLLSS